MARIPLVAPQRACDKCEFIKLRWTLSPPGAHDSVPVPPKYEKGTLSIAPLHQHSEINVHQVMKCYFTPSHFTHCLQGILGNYLDIFLSDNWVSKCIFHYLMKLFLRRLVQWTSKLCLFHILKHIVGCSLIIHYYHHSLWRNTDYSIEVQIHLHSSAFRYLVSITSDVSAKDFQTILKCSTARSQSGWMAFHRDNIRLPACRPTVV